MTTHAAPTPTAADRTENRSLAQQGLRPSGCVHWNLVTPELIQQAVRRDEGMLADMGPFVAVTSPHTGRSPNDKFVVRDPEVEKDVWWGKVNQPMSPENFDVLLADVRKHLDASADLFVQDLWTGADPAHRLSVRFVSPNAWHMQFVRNMFLRPTPADLATFVPGFTVLHAPEMQADPKRHGTKSTTFIVISFAKKAILIGGTRYAGELKKSIFTVMQYLMPKQNVLSMHCSANVGEQGDTALFFGLSGTGKTTLSADPHRFLVGDDEHGWSDDGIFNFEGGCYAKAINLSAEGEPEIYRTTQMFGTVLENAVLNPVTRQVDFADASITENTRVSYPMHYIKRHVAGGRARHPKNVVFLTADAFGVLPPIAALTREQAMYYFLSGYTAKVAGTERGVKEPQATFSAAFGAVFLVFHPSRYAQMLGTLLERHDARVWLVNTGWTGGPYGVGERMKLGHTRAMVRAALAGELTGVPTNIDPVFGLAVPKSIRDVPVGLLSPRDTWKDPAEYDAQAKILAQMFAKNFEQFADGVDASVRSAAPRG